MKYLYWMFLIAVSLTCIGTFYWALSYYQREQEALLPIRFIAQTGPIKEGLKTEYFAEILTLSVDRPKYLSPIEAQNILKKHPLIKQVAVDYWPPDTLYIDYTVRHPVFILGDVENIGVDLDGCFFPLRPYFTPKKLPELYLGIKENASKENASKENAFKENASLYQPLKDTKLVLAIDLLSHFKEDLKRIDLSKIDAPSLGRREVIVVCNSSSGCLQTLRLSPTRYQREILNYERLKDQIPSKEWVIDLRIPDLAYLTSFETCN